MDNRIFESGAQPAPPTPPAVPSVGYPTDGSAVAPVVPPTIPGSYWFYQIGEELRAVLTAAGLVPSDADLTQLHQAIDILIQAQTQLTEINSTNGVLKLPGGFTAQWALVTTVAANNTINFNATFTVACYGVLCLDTGAARVNYGATPISLSQFSQWGSAAGNILFWLAIGR